MAWEDCDEGCLPGAGVARRSWLAPAPAVTPPRSVDCLHQPELDRYGRATARAAARLPIFDARLHSSHGPGAAPDTRCREAAVRLGPEARNGVRQQRRRHADALRRGTRPRAASAVPNSCVARSAAACTTPASSPTWKRGWRSTATWRSANTASTAPMPMCRCAGDEAGGAGGARAPAAPAFAFGRGGHRAPIRTGPGGSAFRALASAGLVRVAKALAAHQATPLSPRTAFDGFHDALARGDGRAAARNLAAVLRRLRLFVGEAGYSMCHSGRALERRFRRYRHAMFRALRCRCRLPCRPEGAADIAAQAPRCRQRCRPGQRPARRDDAAAADRTPPRRRVPRARPAPAGAHRALPARRQSADAGRRRVSLQRARRGTSARRWRIHPAVAAAVGRAGRRA